MNYNISEDIKSAICDYFDYLIAEGDVWEENEEDDEDTEEGDSYWKFFINFKKINELLSEGRRDDEKIHHVKRFLSMYLLYDDGLLKKEFDYFDEWYYYMVEKEPPFSLTINWMLGYIDSGVWIVEHSYAPAA